VYYDFKRNHRLLQLAPERFLCSFLDATKSFDRIKYCKLFKLLIRRLARSRIRLLINYVSCYLGWGDVKRFFSSRRRWTGQCFKPCAVWFVYKNTNQTLMLLALSWSGVSCYIGSIFTRSPYNGERGNVIVMYGCVCVTKWARRAVAEPFVAQLPFLAHLKGQFL